MPIAQEFWDQGIEASDNSNGRSQQLAGSVLKDDEKTSTSPWGFDSADKSNELPSYPFNGRISPSETRQELIERIKRSQRLPWQSENEPSFSTAPQSPKSVGLDTPSSTLLPAAEIQQHPDRFSQETQERLAHPSNIERPRSALHSGDFREKQSKPVVERQLGQAENSSSQWLSTSPTSPWYTASFPRKDNAYQGTPGDVGRISVQRYPRTRAASYTARSNSFAFLPPTSPLANESIRDDSDRPNSQLRPRSPDKSRRHTFSPHSLQTYRRSPLASENQRYPSGNGHNYHSRRESAYPYQAHQPRRSLSSFPTSFDGLAPLTPSARTRPLSTLGSSPMQRLPMVGRYEESILRGRMSSLPSRPLDFVAQIGVLGKGKCKASLRCPSHVSVAFPAVFYHYGGRPNSPTSSEGPSPYVGLIDLEHGLTESHRPDTGLSRRSDSPVREFDNLESGIGDENSPLKGKHIRPSHFRNATQRPPGGSYRIPQQGQLQIIIKNPNKTAVKLFLVPYDLTGMEAGQKTFIRQRSYSAGPIIDMPLYLRTNLGTDRPEAAITNSDDPKDRPMLRYLIHLHICCPSRGRYYLYKSIRVVFANRVPDGKEKLRNEIQLPEPRYTPYKPGRDSLSSQTSTIANSPQVKGWTPLGSYENGHGYDVKSYGDEDYAWRQPNEMPHAYTLPFKTSSPQFSSFITRSNMEDVDMGIPDQSSSPVSPLTQKMPLESPLLAAVGSPGLERSRSRPSFEQVQDTDFRRSSVRDRTKSPQPGEGLLALQLRDSGGQTFR